MNNKSIKKNIIRYSKNNNGKTITIKIKKRNDVVLEHKFLLLIWNE